MFGFCDIFFPKLLLWQEDIRFNFPDKLVTLLSCCVDLREIDGSWSIFEMKLWLLISTAVRNILNPSKGSLEKVLW